MRKRFALFCGFPGNDCRSFVLADLVLFIALFAFEDYACLIPDNASLPLGLRATDLGVLCAVVWSLYVFVQIRGTSKGRTHIGGPFILAVMSTIISAIQGMRLLGQPILLGILPFRRMYAAMFLAVAVVYALRGRILARDRLVSMLYVLGIFELIVYTLQAILASHVTFLATSTSEMRFGLSRLRVPFLLPVLIGMMSFHTFLDSKQKERLSVIGELLIAIWSLLFVALICQHRAPTIILLVSYAIAILFSRGSASTKVLGSFLAILFSIAVAATPMIQTTVQSLTGNTSSISQNTLEIRADGHAYYFQKLQYSPLFGYGWPNQNYLPATVAAGEEFNYYAADNGIFGLAYMLGAFGCLWISIIYAGALHRSWMVKRISGGAIFQYFLFETGNLYMGLHWFYYYPMPFMIALALLDHDYDEVKTLNDKG